MRAAFANRIALIIPTCLTGSLQPARKSSIFRRGAGVSKIKTLAARFAKFYVGDAEECQIAPCLSEGFACQFGCRLAASSSGFRKASPALDKEQINRLPSRSPNEVRFVGPNFMAFSPTRPDEAPRKGQERNLFAATSSKPARHTMSSTNPSAIRRLARLRVQPPVEGAAAGIRINVKQNADRRLPSGGNTSCSRQG